jgi:hypothetical protein
VYIYTMARGNPKLLWFFHTYADGAGALKNMSAEDGDLVIELYGRNVMRAGVSTFDLGEPCYECNQDFTRWRFHWDGKWFRQNGKEVLPLTGKQD